MLSVHFLWLGAMLGPVGDNPRVLWSAPTSSHSFGAGAIADADGDGNLDVAFASYFGDAKVRVLRGKDGSELWSYHDPDPERDDCYDASLRFADLGDGKLSLVVPCSSGCRVLAFDAATGAVKWNTYLGDGECIDTPPFIGVVDGVGTIGVVVGTFKGKLHVLGSDGKILRSIKVAPGAVQSCPIVTDLDADGVPDFIAGNFKGDHAMHAVSGRDGSELWSVATGSHIYHGASVWNPRGDGSMHFVFGSYDGKVYSVDAKGAPDFTIAPGERYFMSPTAILDIDGDGKDECIAACEKVSAINAEGNVLWQHTVGASGGWTSITRGVSIADLNADGAKDLAYLTGDGVFRVLNAKDGSVQCEFNAGGVCGEGHFVSDSSHGPVIGDLNGDGLLDVFFVVGGGGNKKPDGRVEPRFGRAICLTGFAGKASADNAWPMIRHDIRNSGNVRGPIEPAKKAE
ncbi:MAG: PQQ-like beta-propeller repeat protein [Phycisphaerales bacterium]|jgi:outer membrane protein assembly factor BamB|nr:PQQ-like beta-propeller repeat protein [Phycisphaerales bacterium]